MVEKISSHQNPRLKLVKRLRDKKDRDRESLFVVDYERDLERALACGYKPEFVLVDPAGLRLPLMNRLTPDQVFEVTPDIMEKVSYRANPSSIVAVLRQPPAMTLKHLNAEHAPLLGLVNLQKPGNIGALLRTADASGFQSILLIDTALDLYNPNIIRSSTGACFRNNIYQLTGEQAREFFKTNSIFTVAAHLSGTQSLFDVNFPRKTAVILGTEDQGLDDMWASACDVLVKIPMSGQVTDSLNVSVSGAVFMYEVFRQNSKPHA